MVKEDVEPAVGSANEYRRLLLAKKPKKLHKVEVPSGFIWELQEVDVQGYIKIGRLPESLVRQFVESAKRRGIVPKEVQLQDLEAIGSKLSGDETVAALIFMRELVREAAVNPRIVPVANGPDEIQPEEIDAADFDFILNWVLEHAGVAGLTGLQTFHSRRERRANNARGKRQKLRSAPVGPA